MKAKITIVRTDNVVVVDGVGLKVDCTSLPGYIKAIQWVEDTGWIEFVQDHKGQFLKNQKIVDFTDYVYLVEKWNEAKAAADAMAAADAEAKASGPLALAALRK